MVAKKTLVPLFVRIPSDLKQKVEGSATANDTSMSREVARLLQERLQSSLSTDFKFRSEELRASLYKKQLEAVEALVLACVANKDATAGTMQLSLLGEKVLEIRHRRQQTARDIQRQREEQEAFFAQPTQRVEGPFAALLQPNYPDSLPQRLEKSELRRLNLLEELKSRTRGTKAQLATVLGCTPGYLSQMLSDPSSAGHRSINSEVARTLEAALKLKRGALDRLKPGSDIAAIQQATAELGKVLRKMKRLR